MPTRMVAVEARRRCSTTPRLGRAGAAPAHRAAGITLEPFAKRRPVQRRDGTLDHHPGGDELIRR